MNARTARDEAQVRQPKYVAIYQTLATEIADGVHKPGDPLPSQRELSQRFEVTLMTIRQAVGMLKDEGLVDVRQGAGTVVSQGRFQYQLGPLRSLSEDFIASGQHMRTDVLGIARVQPPARVADRLGIDGEFVVAVERLRSADAEDRGLVPIILQTSYLREEYGGRVSMNALRDRSLYQVLDEDFGIRVGRAEETIVAAVLGEREARLLGTLEGAPALLSCRLTYDVHDVPVLDDWALLGADVALSATRLAERTTIHYAMHDSGKISDAVYRPPRSGGDPAR
ncbi:GntR family transcriptional regulator [Nocardia sp. NPDC059177]|uniref:GntR family transcriptional regulator n=1 Tax=Nocardia sp. NPDC059177 TaxID=3346759 RepID=UPI003695EB3E